MKFERVKHWTPEAEAGLVDVLGRHRAGVIADVQAGLAELYRIDEGRTWLVTRLEGDELVICCMQGRGARELMPYLLQAAQRADCLSVRFHTERPALKRLLAPYGFELAEYVFRARVLA